MTWTMAEAQRRDWKNRAREIASNERDLSPDAVYQKREITTHAQSQLSKTGKIYLPVTPMGAVRQVRGDYRLARLPDYQIPGHKLSRIRKVRRYQDFKRAIKENWPEGVPYPVSGYHMIFYMPIPPSRRKGKRKVEHGMPHQQSPDKDNIEKAVLDALYDDDSHVWDGRCTKLWGDAGYIEIYLNTNSEEAKQ